MRDDAGAAAVGPAAAAARHADRRRRHERRLRRAAARDRSRARLPGSVNLAARPPASTSDLEARHARRRRCCAGAEHADSHFSSPRASRPTASWPRCAGSASPSRRATCSPAHSRRGSRWRSRCSRPPTPAPPSATPAPRARAGARGRATVCTRLTVEETHALRGFEPQLDALMVLDERPAAGTRRP